MKNNIKLNSIYTNSIITIREAEKKIESLINNNHLGPEIDNKLCEIADLLWAAQCKTLDLQVEEQEKLKQ